MLSSLLLLCFMMYEGMLYIFLEKIMIMEISNSNNMQMQTLHS